jgi:hypothetical protein
VAESLRSLFDDPPEPDALDEVEPEEPPEEPVDPCPDCGLDPNDQTLHRDDCPRLNTCGQLGPPWIDRPWHPIEEPFSLWYAEHRAVPHG